MYTVANWVLLQNSFNILHLWSHFILRERVVSKRLKDEERFCDFMFASGSLLCSGTSDRLSESLNNVE